MIQLNLGDHTSSVPGYGAFPRTWHTTIKWARQRAFWIAANVRTANPYFRTLPGGRSLTQLLGDGSIWVNHATFNYYGETEFAGGKEMAVSEYCWPYGRWTILATLIHELAHVNGVGGGSKDAERAVLECGMGKRSENSSGTDDRATPYDPRIIGMIPGAGAGSSYA